MLFPWRKSPGPHNWKLGLKDAPLHLGAFGVPFGIACHFIPPPYNFAALGGLAIWRAIAERQDYKQGDDTKGKAVIDFATQVAGGALGTFL